MQLLIVIWICFPAEKSVPREGATGIGVWDFGTEAERTAIATGPGYKIETNQGMTHKRRTLAWIRAPGVA